MTGDSLSRRRLLGSAAALLATGGLAGCADGDQEGDRSATPDADGRSDASVTDDSGDAGTEQGTDALDLRETNVVVVAVAREGDAYAFDVTLHHDDDGEDGYADWWQVERLDGTRLGRRDLAHPHSSRPFTRSATIEVPEVVTCVVVRGHDQTHGYGGRATLVDLESGATRAVDQGSEKRAFGESDCPVAGS